GLANATSDWIQFLDADDELLKGKLAGQFSRVKPDIAFIVGNSIHVFPDGRRHYRKSDTEIWKGLIRSKLGDTCANLWNKNDLLMVGGWNEKLSSSQEYDLMFRLASSNPYVVFDNRYLTLIYKTENSISTHLGKKKKRSKNWLKLRDKIRKHLVNSRKFHLLNKYYWAGAVGMFCDENQIDFPGEVDKWFYQLYKMEISIKKKTYNWLKFN
ncbi:MAG: glycosyltransferase, partial [Cyclobacteriaceae bacterium]